MGDDAGLLGETSQAMNGMAVCRRAKTQYRKVGCQRAGSLSLGPMLLTLTFPGGTDPIPGIRQGWSISDRNVQTSRWRWVFISRHTLVSQKLSGVSKWSPWLWKIKSGSQGSASSAINGSSFFQPLWYLDDAFSHWSLSSGVNSSGANSQRCQRCRVTHWNLRDNPMTQGWLSPLYREFGKLLTYPNPRSSKWWDRIWIIIV